MDSPGRAYFLARAEAELDRANEARQPSDAWAHYDLVAYYLGCADAEVANDD